ncbi:MAG: NPCBM/NEW2 domain-containing protein, partial [Bacteroidota bacterium]
MRKFIYLLIIQFLLSNCNLRTNETHITYLDSLEFDHIVNLYGPPNKNLSFSKDTLNINNVKYIRGLGLHAPAHLSIDLNGKAKRFYAEFGIDKQAKKFLDPELMSTIENFPDYVYDNQADHYDLTKGSSVILTIVVDGDSIYISPLTGVFDDARIADVKLNRAEKIEIIADPTNDGSFADHVNLVNAYIEWKEIPANLPSIYYYPEDILVNHAGFMPESSKTCFLAGSGEKEFIVIEKNTGEQVYKGNMFQEGGDLGNYLKGDFSDLTNEGTYFLQSGRHRSVDFEVSPGIYLASLQKHINYI